MAYLTAVSHGLTDRAEAILAAAAAATQKDVQIDTEGILLKPPIPILKQQNSPWPQRLSKKKDAGLFNNAPPASVEPAPAAVSSTAAMSVWEKEEEERVGGLEVEADEEMSLGAWGIEEVEITTTEEAAPTETIKEEGIPETELWCHNSPLVADHLAAGAFDSAMQLLFRQAGIVNFEPLKPIMLAVALSSQAYLSAFPCLPPLAVPLRRNPDERDPRKVLPVLVHKFRAIVTGPLQEAYRATTSGKFVEARALFRSLLLRLACCGVSSASDADEHKQLLNLCKEYIVGLSLELERKSCSDSKRALELAAYFTHCQLQPVHQQLSLQMAMSLSFNAKNYLSASSFARRLLDLNPPAAVAAKARKIKSASDKTPRDEITLVYDEYSPFDLCAASLTPLYQGSENLLCPFCHAAYQTSHRNSLCVVCQLSLVGSSGTGLRVWLSP